VSDDAEENDVGAEDGGGGDIGDNGDTEQRDEVDVDVGRGPVDDDDDDNDDGDDDNDDDDNDDDDNDDDEEFKEEVEEEVEEEVDEDAEEGESNDGVDSYDETIIRICADDDDDVDDEDAAVDKTTPNRNATGRAAAVRSFMSENGILGPPGISKEKFAEEFPHAGATALRLLPQVWRGRSHAMDARPRTSRSTAPCSCPASRSCACSPRCVRK